MANDKAEPAILAIQLEDFTINPADQNKRTYGVDSPNGLKDWFEFVDEPEQLLDPQESIAIKYKINIPQDAQAGTYMTSFNLTAKDPVKTAGSGVAVASRILGNAYLTVSGEIDEQFDIVNFKLDEEKLKNGEIVFNTEGKNNGNAFIVGMGTITIFDSTGKQVKGIRAVTQDFDGQMLVAERFDELLVNNGAVPILPNTTGTYRTAWTHRQVAEGAYTAKLKLFYGQENKQISKDFNFEITENFAILNLQSEKFFNASLPVDFEAKIANTGNVALSPKGYFEVKSIFGTQKHRIDIESLSLLGGQEVELNDLKWESGLALGLYSANLHLDVNGQVFEKSSMFWVLTWWQGLIILIVLVLLIAGLYKGIHGYRAMKKRLNEMTINKEDLAK
ncbi:hypothetical protein KKD70_05385 [Patescibacteria group bacterium]|nr:hypothetical protein [Patescibacteria group bacterium]